MTTAQTFDNILDILRSGEVRRWHQNPEMVDCNERNSSHQWDTVMILLYLDPNVSRDTLLYALTHDVGELIVGDLSSPFKREYPEVAQDHRTIEMAVREHILCGNSPLLTYDDATLIQTADRLAAYWRMIRHRPALRHDAEWRGMVRELRLGPHDEKARAFMQTLDAYAARVSGT